jgi:hypothetical protein
LLHGDAEFSLRDLDIVLSGTIRGNKVEETVVDIALGPKVNHFLPEQHEKVAYKLVFRTIYVGNVHVVSGRRDIFL